MHPINRERIAYGFRSFASRLMRLALKIVAGIVGSLLLLAVGLFLGFNAGYGYRSASNASTQSALTVSTLRALRENKTDKAIKSLETSLDGDLITSWAFRDSWLTRVVLSCDDERILLGRAAEYRREFPSQSPSADVRAWIDEIAAKNCKQ